uniref:Uncharacterized protein n=1 Tax=Octopus bimaculoides TaxID=37653 RepID=A0A0L8IGG7_OCTBM
MKSKNQNFCRNISCDSLPSLGIFYLNLTLAQILVLFILFLLSFQKVIITLYFLLQTFST